MAIKAVLFDLDNTLVDFMALKRQCVNAAVDAMINAGLTLPKSKTVERIYQIYYKEGLEDQQIFDKFLKQEFGEVDYKLLVVAIIAYREARSQISTYPNVARTIIKLGKMGVKVAIVSDAPRLPAWTRLAEANLHELFDTVLTSDDTGKHKPHPKPFITALDRLGVSPEETLMVGDWYDKDMVGAHAVGIRTAYVMYSDEFARKSESETEGVVDHRIQSITEVIDIVKNAN